ncbi:MAG: DUF484 domain-containing protein [Betaproteobacteria bacterium HGW-Betaproteobacteria-22]|nr:MAG: DUF484 domain-containing protein [Betaproteobacteria bacterium HGW-Betaproteobacteria-22]
MTYTPHTAISADEVKDYLRNHPDFFELHAHLLADITLPNPHGNGVISLAERQQLAQRDKIRVLEAMMAQMIKHAEENDAISEKVHQFSVNLLNQQSFSALQHLIAETLQLDFGVTQSLIRIWVKPSNNAIAQDAVFTQVSEEFNEWVMRLNQPHCGHKPDIADNLLEGELKSFAFVPLSKKAANQRPFGVLILGADDAQRFKVDMGTLYLEHIGELVSAALLNHLFTLNL